MQKKIAAALIVFSFFTIFSSPSKAAETVRWKENSYGSVEFWMKRKEDGRIYLEYFEAKPGKLQKLLKRLSYNSESLADRTFNNFTEGYTEQKPSRFVHRGGLSTELKGKVIWPTTKEWNSDWENKFSDWVRDNVDKMFFSKYNIATDCADVPVALRWIFARIHGLPTANHLMGSGLLFGNESMREEWLSLPITNHWDDDPRFLAALDYVLIHTYTHSIMNDLYPVKINSEGVAPGTLLLHLYNEETGHTELIRWAGKGQANAIQMIASTVPREVRELMDYGIQDWGEPPIEEKSGLLRFLWPIQNAGSYELASPSQMPLHSIEQYSPHFSDGYATFTDAVIAKVVPGFSFDPKLALRARTSELWDRLKARVPIVEDGFSYCSKNGCEEGSAAWEIWSTPSRDAAIGRLVRAVDDIYDSSSCFYFCRHELDAHKNQTLTKLQRAYSLNDALEAWRKNRFSSDPTDQVNTRWGW